MSRRDFRQKPCLSFISPSAGGAFCKGIVSTARRRGPNLWSPSASRSLLQRHKLHAYPVGDSLQSPVGVAEFYKRYSFVRLPGVGLLFCEEK